MTSIRTGMASTVLAAAAVFSTVALAAPASAAADKPANPASVQAVRCDSTYVPPNRDSTVGGFLTSASIRTGPSTRCASVGLGQRGHRADYYCYVSGDGGTWTYLRDINTGKRGWVRDDLLTGYGSFQPC